MPTPKPPPFFIQLLNAMDGADLSANARSVLMAQFKFGTHANGRNSRVSEERLAEYTGFSVRTIQRARQELRTEKWLIERERGHNGKDENVASLYDINIPPATVAVQKPRRTPNNPEGFNARKKKSPATGGGKPPASSSGNPSKLPATGDHLSWEPFRGTEKASYQGDSEELVERGSEEWTCETCGGPITDDAYVRTGDGTCTPYRGYHTACTR